MNKRSVFIGCSIVSVTIILIIILITLILKQFKGYQPKDHFVKSNGKIGVVYINGVISAGSSGGIFSEMGTGAEAIVRALEKGGRGEDIKVILIRINSPGGSAAASQEIFAQIRRIKTKYRKPVVVSMGDVAASGGYYIASAADILFANPATFTGSIGVIMETFNTADLLKKIGLTPNTFKSVKYKDIGSPFREISYEEKKILQDAIDDVHKQFVRDVASGRKMDIKIVEKLADGRFYTGEQAFKLKLVDRLGGFQDAINYAAMRVGITPVPEIENLRKESPLSILFGTFNKTGIVDLIDMQKRNFIKSDINSFVINLLLAPYF